MSADAPARAAARTHPTFAPGLDGLRAIAVALVVTYHLGASWLPGGFLGVDVFFVLSGFLITSLIAHEVAASGRLDVRRFYLRRARRLLPALATMLAAVVVATAVCAPAELHRLRGDVLAALGYSSNWTQIAWNRSYFAALGRPSLLQHLWSLAVEEQFYLLWPLILLVTLRTSPRRALRVTVGGVLVSTLLMAVLFRAGHDPSRVYYGSDTHAAPLLVGAALALATVTCRAVLLDLAAAAGAVVLALCVLHAGYESPLLYRGGYLVVALAAGAVVLAAARPGTVTSRLLGGRALRWVGVRSYATYLWHWPVLMLTRPRLDVPFGGAADVLLRLVIVLGAAALSYRLVEDPIRRRGVRAWFASTAAPQRRPVAALVAVAATVLAVVVQLSSPAAMASGGVQYDTGARQHVTVAPVAGGFPRPVRVTFFGDSQGMTLLLNRPDGLAASMTLTDGTVEGCGILRGTIHSSRGVSRDLDGECAGWQDKWRAAAAASHPQIAVVEIGAWEVFDDTVDGTLLRFGTPAWDAEFDRQVASAVAILTGAGAQVALLGVPCYRPIDAGGLQALPERGDDTRTRHVTALLATSAAHDPRREFFVSPPAQFCTDPAIATSTSYRWDGVHYYKPGAALMFQTITPQLLRIPPP